jgi:hypothetical protein
MGGRLFGMGDHQQRGTALCHLLRSAPRVRHCPGRDCRSARRPAAGQWHQSACQGNALLFATREFAWWRVGARCESDAIEHLGAPHRFGLFDACQQQGHGDIGNASRWAI